ncbi:hypothetical protein [Oceanirhabdus seepicola]|uniref:Uncharacterized protein n=1 Tax=Oceanirhabdus seepicola TaxID=2828781 RepID=A0A9J6P3X4_9CLOT|nr:hypothetical protein [Oceanirhabdus seepicola]MCM1990264.1 hypothetical protein [Oceanirhabdus seepicola]
MSELHLNENFTENDSLNEVAASLTSNSKSNYDDKFILKRLLEGHTRDDIAAELRHKNYRTLDMYMRRRGYIWDTFKQTYIPKLEVSTKVEPTPALNKVQKIINLFNTGNDPMEIAKKVGMKDHRVMAEYMKNKGYFWSAEKQNYSLAKGKQSRENFEIHRDSIEIHHKNDEITNYNDDLMREKVISKECDTFSNIDRLQNLLPMLEMIDKHKDKLAELLSTNISNTIPRYVIGGITITKSLCMSHPLSELIKDFSREKNISQREIFEVAIIEFLNKYGYENEINSLFID